MDQQKQSDSTFYLIKNTNLAPVLNSFTQLFEETVLHDVTLACGDGNIQNSRALLALAFPLLEKVLQNREDEFLVLVMPDFSQAEIRYHLEALLMQNLATNELNPKLIINHPLKNDEKSLAFDILSIEIKPERTEIPAEIPDVDSFDLTTNNFVQELLINKEESILKEDLEASLPKTKQTKEEKTLENICNQCGKAKHLIPNLCKECGKECCSEWRLKLHMLTHKSTVCNVCGKIFESKNRFRLKTHLATHTKKANKHLQRKYKNYIKYSDSFQVLCKFCDFEFKGNANDQFKSHVEKHITDKQSKEKELFTFEHYVSELVRLEESLTGGRRVNFKLRTQDKFGNFNCTACEFNSKSIKQVLSHRKSKHSEQLGRRHHDEVRTKQTHLLHEMKKRSFIPDTALSPNQRCTPWNIEVLKKFQPINQLICDSCDFITKNSEKLRRHVFTAHSTTKYECEVCGESNFTEYRNVKGHQMEKHDMWGGMISCDHCEDKFTHESLRTHIRSMNKGSSSSIQSSTTKCGICQVACRNYKSLNLHVQIEHLPVISREIGITGDLKTENSLLQEEIAEIFAISQFVKGDDENVMLCKLCLRTIQDYSNKMTFHMKTHLGFNIRRQVQSDKEAAKLLFDKYC